MLRSATDRSQTVRAGSAQCISTLRQWFGDSAAQQLGQIDRVVALADLRVDDGRIHVAGVANAHRLALLTGDQDPLHALGLPLFARPAVAIGGRDLIDPHDGLIRGEFNHVCPSAGVALPGPASLGDQRR